MKYLAAILAIFLVTSLIGCDSKKDLSENEKHSLLLYCGAGIRPPVEKIVETFSREHGIEIHTDFAGSETLLSKISLSHKGDLYLPGDKRYVDQAKEKGYIIDQKPIFYFVPTILVQKGNPHDINSLQDLIKPGIQIGLGDPQACAIGRLCKDLFAKNGISWNQLQENLKFKSLTVNELGMQIQADSLDAVIVWMAVANYYLDHGDIITIPTDDNIISSVNIGALKFSEKPKNAALFMEFITSDRARQIFQEKGYNTIKPD